MAARRPASGNPPTRTGFRQMSDSIRSLDFATEVRPWFGGQAGFGLWTAPGGRLLLLTAFSSTDDGLARKLLYAHHGLGFLVSDGYVLVCPYLSRVTSDLTAAVDEARHHPPVDHADFRCFGGSRTITVDPATGTVEISDVPPGWFPPLGNVAGTFAVGASMVSDGILVRMHAQGLAPRPAGTAPVNMRPAMDSMPSATVVGLAFNGLDPTPPLVSDVRAFAAGLVRRLPAGLAVTSDGTRVGAGDCARDCGGKLGGTPLYTETMAGMSQARHWSTSTYRSCCRWRAPTPNGSPTARRRCWHRCERSGLRRPGPAPPATV
jgi:hypothetical protein